MTESIPMTRWQIASSVGAVFFVVCCMVAAILLRGVL